MKVLVCRVGEQPVVEDVPSPWNRIKELLATAEDKDPTIQIVPLDDVAELYCDEDALGKNLPFNRLVPATARIPPGFENAEMIYLEDAPGELARPGEPGNHHVHGTFLLAGPVDDEGETTALSEEAIAIWTFNLTISSRRGG